MRALRTWVHAALVALAGFLLVGTGLAGATEPKTFFDILDRAWAVGELRLSSPLEYREGRVLVFPAHITDLVHARAGKPRTLMLVYERSATQGEPFFKEGDRLLAAVGVLPEHSYWRDNLPDTKRHEILGGRRYAFKANAGGAMDVARAIAKAYTATLGEKMPLRARLQASVMVDALLSSVPVLATDGLHALAQAPRLARDLEVDSSGKLLAFLADSSRDLSIRSRLARAAGEQGADVFIPVLQELSEKDAPMAAVAFEALDNLGRERSSARLLALLEAETVELRVYAAEALGRRVAGDEKALEAVSGLLSSQGGADVDVRLAAARGLGGSASPKAIDVLAAAVSQGDAVTRTAAVALARIGGPRVHALLKEAITGGPPEAMVASVMAMVELREECEGCLEFLAEQYRSHEQAAVREMIGIMLELHKKHEH